MTTIETLRFIFNNNGWSEIDYPAAGHTVHITPCYYVSNPSEEQIEYFLMSCSAINLCGGETLDYVASVIDGFANLLDEDTTKKSHIRKFFETHIQSGVYTEEEWSFYSDWHKSLYGYRPHGLVCGQYVLP